MFISHSGGVSFVFSTNHTITLRSFDEGKSRLELVFSNETTAMQVLKAIIVDYPITEFYRKKETLIEKVYNRVD